MTCHFPGCPRRAESRGLCQSHGQQRRKGVALTPLPEPRPCARCIDAEWLADAGECLDRVAQRLGLAPRSLVRHLERHDRADLLARLRPYADITPTPYR